MQRQITRTPSPRAKTMAFDDWQRDFALVSLPTLAVFAACAFMPTIFMDGDTNWHVAAGRWILEHRTAPTTDPFSYTFQGHAWTSHEWLSEVLFAMAYAAAVWGGVALLTGAAAAIATAVVAWALRARLGALSVIAMLGMSFAVLVTVLLARPHVLALAPLAIWTASLVEARRQGRRPSYWLLPVMLAWANMHGSYIVGLGLAGAFALEAFLAAVGRRAHVALAWGGFLLAAAATSLATPHGLGGWLFPFQVMGMETLTSIEEWRSSTFDRLGSLEIALGFTLFICLYRGVRIGAVRLLLLLLLLHMALHQLRHAGLLAVLAPMLLRDGLAEALEPDRPNAHLRPRPAWVEFGASVAVAVALFLGIGAARLAQPIMRSDSVHVPVTALARVPAEIAVQPVLNDYAFGGWLIFKGRRPFIDGRADMYGDAFLRRYLAMEAGDASAFDRGVRQYGFRWTILKPESPLVKLLDKRPEWRRLYADHYAVVHVHEPDARSFRAQAPNSTIAR